MFKQRSEITLACDRASRTKKSLTLSHTESLSLSLEMQMEEAREDGPRGKAYFKRPWSKRLAQLSPARIGGLRTKIWAGVRWCRRPRARPLSSRRAWTPQKGAQPPPPPPAVVRVWSATWRRRQPGGYTVLYVGRGYDGRPAGYVPMSHVARSILLHSTSSPHTLGLS